MDKKKGLEQKKKVVDGILNQSSFLANTKGKQDVYLSAVAKMLVNPGVEEPVLMPRPFPVREGVARYPLTLTIKGTANYSNIGIIARPLLQAPLQVSEDSAHAESTSYKYSTWAITGGAVVSADGDIGCNVSGNFVGSSIAMPLLSAAGATVSVTFTGQGLNMDVQCELFAWDGTSWTSLGTTTRFGISVYSVTLSGLTWTNAYTHYKIVVGTPQATFMQPAGIIQLRVHPTVGTLGCKPYSQTAMVPYHPPWDNLIEVADIAIITAMDCLVTYMGSSLEDSGAIACCDGDLALPIVDDDFYSTILSRPYDVYDGRLASKGGELGGAHWHCMPGSQAQIFGPAFGTDSETDNSYRAGYFGIKGLGVDQEVRIKMNVCVQYRTLDPSYRLDIPPPMRDMSCLLHAIATEVGPVSANESHTGKVKKVGKALARLGKSAYDNREEIAKLAGMVAKLAPLLLA